MMRIEWLFPHLEQKQYLVFATVCKEWKRFLDARGYAKVTAIVKSPTIPLLEWAYDNGMPMYEQLMYDAGFEGNRECIKWLTKRVEFDDVDTLMYHISWGGHLDLLKEVMRNQKAYHASRIALGAALGGHVHILKHMGNLHVDSSLYIEAAKGGSIETLEFIHSFDDKIPARATNWAAQKGNLKALIWLCEHEAPWNDLELSDAAKGGHMDVVRWIVRNKSPDLTEGTLCTGAASGGHLDILRWARRKGFHWDEKTTAAAGAGGHGEVLKWAWMKGCPWNLSLSHAAAEYGHYDLVLWAARHGAPLDTTVMYRAVEHGDIKIVRALRAASCPWDHKVIPLAYRYGHIELMYWLGRKGAQVRNSFIEELFINEDEEHIKWAVRHVDTNLYSSSFGRYASVPLLQWLKYDFGYVWADEFGQSEFIKNAAYWGNVKALDWALDNGYSWSIEAWKEAIEGGHMKVLEWAYSKRMEWNEEVCEHAAMAGEMKILKWLRKRKCPWNWQTLGACECTFPHIYNWALKNGCPEE